MQMKVTTAHADPCMRQIANTNSPFLNANMDAPVNAYLLRPDMAVCFWECTTNTPKEYTITFDTPVLQFSFILEGESISSADEQKDFARHKELIEMRFFHANSGQIRLAAHQSHKWLDIVLSPSFLDLALPEESAHLPESIRKVVLEEVAHIPCDSRRMTPDQFVAATQLAHCPYTHAARTLFLKSKTLELLSHVLAVHSPTPCQTHLSSYEMECLKTAKDILIADVENPPTLKELSIMVGLNETKLKTGFKALFGQTVYGYFKTYRIELARQRLLDETCSISQVASSVGYTNISHFSAAFKERHGVTPSRYRKDNFFVANFSQK